MKTIYKPRGVCSRLMTVEIEGGIIQRVSIEGGCNGNLQGISGLVAGMTAEEAIKRLRGIRCDAKKTSCPDQLSYALEDCLNEENGNINQTIN